MEGLTLDLLTHPAGLLILLGGLLVAVYFMRGRVDELREALKSHNAENKADFEKVHQRIGDLRDENKADLKELKDEVHQVHNAVTRIEAKETKDG